MIQAIHEIARAMATLLVARFVLNDVPHALGLNSPPLKLSIGRRVRIAGTLYHECVSFVEGKLGAFRQVPVLVCLEDVGDTPEPYDRAAAVVEIDPGWLRPDGQTIIFYSSKIMPEDPSVQKELMLHELSEIRYDELGRQDIHGLASAFEERYWVEAGAATRETAERKLIKRGYYRSFVWAPDRVFQEALEEIPFPHSPWVSELMEERRRTSEARRKWETGREKIW